MYATPAALTERNKIAACHSLADLLLAGMTPLYETEFLEFEGWRLSTGALVWTCPKCQAIVSNPMMGCDYCGFPPF